MLDITICTEVDLIQLLKSTADIEKRGWDVIHQHDSPQNIALLPTIDPKKVKHLISRLDFLNIDQNEHIDGNNTDNWQAQAGIHYCLDKFIELMRIV